MLHVCTVPCEARLCGSSLGLLRSVLGSRCDPAANTPLHLVSQVDMRARSASRHTYQVQRASDQMVLHTGAILRSPSSHHDDRMLLDVVTCALVSRLRSQPHTWLRRTFAGDVGGNDLPCAQTHPGNLALARVGLLGLGCADLQAHALQLRPVRQLRRSQLSRPLLYPALAQHLDQRALVGARSRCGREGEAREGLVERCGCHRRPRSSERRSDEAAEELDGHGGGGGGCGCVVVVVGLVATDKSWRCGAGATPSALQGTAGPWSLHSSPRPQLATPSAPTGPTPPPTTTTTTLRCSARNTSGIVDGSPMESTLIVHLRFTCSNHQAHNSVLIHGSSYHKYSTVQYIHSNALPYVHAGSVSRRPWSPLQLSFVVTLELEPLPLLTPLYS